MSPSTVFEDLENIVKDFPNKVRKFEVEDGWDIKKIVEHVLKMRVYPDVIIVREKVAYVFIKWNEES